MIIKYRQIITNVKARQAERCDFNNKNYCHFLLTHFTSHLAAICISLSPGVVICCKLYL